MDDFDHTATARETPGLLVYVPSLSWNPDSTQELLGRLTRDPFFNGWQIKPYNHQIGYFSKFSPESAANDLAEQMSDWSGEVPQSTVPRRIILVGHSLGGLLVREALLQAHKRGPVFTGNTTPWQNRVSRVVLIGSPNAGYELNRLDPVTRLAARAVSLSGRFMFEQLEEGSEYITDLRLRWFEFMTQRGTWRGTSARLPEVVQVLGRNDKYISEENIRDAGFIQNAVTKTVGGAGHADIVNVGRAPNPDGRYQDLRQSICEDLPEIGSPEAEPKEEQKPVVFILHGIRASKTSDWISTLERILREPVSVPEGSNPDTRHVLDWTKAEIVAPTYGYFGVGNFASPWIRRKNTRRLLIWYGKQFLSHNPDNMFFVGHSNGTYMLGRSLYNVPNMRFRRIFLAASVLPKDFPWNEVIERRQVGRFITEPDSWEHGDIHADRGRRDVPVGWACSFLHGLGSRDIGTAGLDGFDELQSNQQEHRYAGGHPHMLTPKAKGKQQKRVAMEARMREVSNFVREGAPHADPETPSAQFFGWFSRILGKAAKLGALVLLGLLFFLATVAGAPWFLTVPLASLYVLWVIVNTF